MGERESGLCVVNQKRGAQRTAGRSESRRHFWERQSLLSPRPEAPDLRRPALHATRMLRSERPASAGAGGGNAGRPLPQAPGPPEPPAPGSPLGLPLPAEMRGLGCQWRTEARPLHALPVSAGRGPNVGEVCHPVQGPGPRLGGRRAEPLPDGAILYRCPTVPLAPQQGQPGWPSVPTDRPHPPRGLEHQSPECTRARVRAPHPTPR